MGDLDDCGSRLRPFLHIAARAGVLNTRSTGRTRSNTSFHAKHMPDLIVVTEYGPAKRVSRQVRKDSKRFVSFGR
jgi:hypothetical protein